MLASCFAILKSACYTLISCTVTALLGALIPLMPLTVLHLHTRIVIQHCPAGVRQRLQKLQCFQTQPWRSRKFKETMWSCQVTRTM